jgi:hypothetical protein
MADRPGVRSERARRLAGGGNVEVDQQIAARDEVQPRERRIGEQIVCREENGLTQLLADAVAIPVLLEESLQTRGRHVGPDVSGIEPFACSLE